MSDTDRLRARITAIFPPPHVPERPPVTLDALRRAALAHQEHYNWREHGGLKGDVGAMNTALEEYWRGRAKQELGR